MRRRSAFQLHHEIFGSQFREPRPQKWLLDNEAVLKVASYGLGATLQRLPTHLPAEMSVLNGGRGDLSERLARLGLQQPISRAQENLEAMVKHFQTLDPSRSEVEMAAQLRHQAGARGFLMGVEESEFCAVGTCRPFSRVLIGGDRMLAALAAVAADRAEVMHLFGRVVCFEQVMMAVLGAAGDAAFRKAVCAEPKVDEAVYLSCGCGGIDSDGKEIGERLAGYIALRKKDAGRLLAQ